MELDFNEIRELLAILNQTDIAEITVKSSNFEITVKKAVQGGAATIAPAAPATGLALPPAPLPVVPTPVPAPAVPSPPPPINERLVEVTSPMVGTFYRAPAPDELPFVNTGDRITTGQTVCIIEAMKLMNEIESEVSGEVVEILVQNGQPVEYGQPLMRVKPA